MLTTPISPFRNLAFTFCSGMKQTDLTCIWEENCASIQGVLLPAAVDEEPVPLLRIPGNEQVQVRRVVDLHVRVHVFILAKVIPAQFAGCDWSSKIGGAKNGQVYFFQNQKKIGICERFFFYLKIF